jgi:hypothetical protein
MRVIGTKLHGYLDYIMGLVVAVSPWIFGFARGGAETIIPVVLGVGVIIYSLMTDYELGVTRTISMRTHLTLDLISGFIMAISPWLFGFADYIWQPHLIFGILEMGASLMSKQTPGTERTFHHRRTTATH